MLYTFNISYTNYTSIKNYENETLKEGDIGPIHRNLFSGELNAVSPRPGGRSPDREAELADSCTAVPSHIILPEDEEELLWVWKERMSFPDFWLPDVLPLPASRRSLVGPRKVHPHLCPCLS